ncbi:MAG: DUF4837 family protein [Bacteroidales bacterium]|nr:DUF4837 family protein [Bacteroidales bacterium]
MKRILSILFAAVVGISTLSSCFTGTSNGVLPNVSGKAGEVIIVMDKDNWEGDLGNAVRETLGGDCPYLAQKEPLYNLVNVSPPGFADLFKVHRNIVIFHIAGDVQEEGMVYRSDVWSHPQCLIQLSAFDSASAMEIFSESSERILSTLEQAERDRIIANSKKYEEFKCSKAVTPMIGGSPHFPSGYKVRKKTDNFIWISDDKQYTNQGVFIYKYPASEVNNFSAESIIAHRNAALQANVPGMFDGTYMTTSTYVEPTVEFIRFRGRQFAQTRGFWEVEGDFMGGPFVSHSFYSQDGSEIIVLDAWVYAPRFDKRHYLRQVESIIYSFEWDKPKNNEEKVAEDGENILP